MATMLKEGPFRVDWLNKESVIEYAKVFGSGHVVFKHPNRPNYNITHASRFDSPTAGYSKEWLVFRT